MMTPRRTFVRRRFNPALSQLGSPISFSTITTVEVSLVETGLGVGLVPTVITSQA
jgi:hypothetical protein